MFVRAADRAARAGAPGASSASYATAAELAQTADQPTDGGRTDAASLWERAADVACIAAQHEPAIEYAQRAKALHERAGRVRDAARAQSLVGRALRLAGRHRAARAELEPAVEVLRENPDVDTVVAIEHLATVAVFDGAPEGDALTAEALALGQALDVGPAVLARLFTARGFAYGFTNRTAEAAACFEYAAHLAAKVGDGHTQGRALANLADALSGDDVPAALEAATAAIDVLRRLGAQDMLDLAVVNQVEQLVTIGRWDEAEQVLDYALSRDATGFRDFVRWQRGWLAALRGDVDVVEESLAGLAHMRASEDPQDRGAVALLEAQAALLAGDQQRALAVARGAVTHTLTIGLRELVVWAWSIATRAAHAQGELATEADLVALLDGYPVGHVPHLLRAERDIARARLARAGLGPDLDDRDPVELFDQAVAALRRVPAPYHVAHALLDEAEGVGGEEGLRLVQEAADIAARLGARPLAQRAASCAAALGAGREPATRAG
jgi:tetratricopeptide (TPR) repeat protein